MSLVPGDLLDEKYDSPVAPVPTPTLSEKWGAVVGSDVADMPTAKVLNMMQVDNGEPEQPDVLNKRYPGMGFQNPISDQAANNAFSQKQAEAQRQDIITRSKWSGWDNFGRGALALTSMIADPVTDALFASTGGAGVIPEALAYRGAAGLVGENFIARGVAGAIGTGTHAAVAGAGLAAVNQAENVDQGKNIDWKQAAIEEMTIVGMGAGLGSLGKAVAGKASEEVVKWNKIFDGSFTMEEKQAVIKNAASQAMGEVGLQEKDILSMTDKVALTEAATGKQLTTVEELTQALEPKQLAYHGSPFDFQTFDMENLGKGEGAQSFGHGLYFAGNENVAEFYKRNLSGKDLINKAYNAGNESDSIGDNATSLKQAEGTTSEQKEFIDALGKDDYLGFDTLHEAISAAIKNPSGYDISPELEQATKNLGKKYTVGLPTDDKLLHFDKPLSEQPEKVKKAISKLSSNSGAIGDFFKKVSSSEGNIGDSLKDHLKEIQKESDLQTHFPGKVEPKQLASSKDISEALDKEGVNGIKYLDKASRKRGEGTSNYVIFNDKNIQSDPAEIYKIKQELEEKSGYLQSQKLNNFRDAIENGSFEPKTESTPEPYTETTPTSDKSTFLEDQHKQADEQLSDLQKQNNDRIKLEEDPEVQQSLKDRLNEGLDEHMQEMERQQDKRSFVRKSLDCFLGSYAQ